MIDKEKVIWGLKCCRNIHAGATLDDSCNKCPFQEEKGRTCEANELFHNALALITDMDITIRALMGEFGDSCSVDGCGGEKDA